VGTTSPSQTVTISNFDYWYPVTVNQIAIPSADPSFSQTNNCPSTLAPGSSCTVNVQYAPTAGADGVESSTLEIETSDTPF